MGSQISNEAWVKARKPTAHAIRSEVGGWFIHSGLSSDGELGYSSNDDVSFAWADAHRSLESADAKWIKKAAERENGGFVSAGGLITDLACAPIAGGEESDEAWVKAHAYPEVHCVENGLFAIYAGAVGRRVISTWEKSSDAAWADARRRLESAPTAAEPVLEESEKVPGNEFVLASEYAGVTFEQAAAVACSLVNCGWRGPKTPIESAVQAKYAAMMKRMADALEVSERHGVCNVCMRRPHKQDCPLETALAAYREMGLGK